LLELDLTADLARQLGVCNACRYCEGFCATFGAAQTRAPDGGPADFAYLANLCHDCRMCFDACMFVPPHEFAINIPEAMARTRAQTYERYAVPALFAQAVRNPVAAAGVSSAIAVAALFVIVALVSGPNVFATSLHGPGAFYRVLPYAAMLGGALALGVYAIACMAAGAVRFARDIGGGEHFVSLRSLGVALRQAVALTYLKGGGAGCYDVTRHSGRRRAFHMLVFWGFVADLASTTSAAIEQDLLHRLPPYPLASVPVLLGTIGGITIAIGAAGLVAVKRAGDQRPADGRMIALDYAFLGLLEAVALTGLALLVFRSTPAMPSLLAVHLGVLAGAFVTAPYGKFVHFVYRSIALVMNAHEQAGGSS
jgi:citrate/tricarballylate utilization protein